MKPFLQITSAAQKGLTLVELMIAMTLGVILITGVLAVFVNTKQAYIDQDASSQLQENARFALEMIGREIRMTRYGGCSSEIGVANLLDGYSGLAEGYEDGIHGYEGTDTNDSFPASLEAALPNTDAIIVHTVRANEQLIIDKHWVNNGTIKFTGKHPLRPGTLLLLVDANCSNMAIFAMSGPANTSSNSKKLFHREDPISGHSYRNCTRKAKGRFTCNDYSGAARSAYSVGSSVFPIDSFAYYIGASSKDLAGQPNSNTDIRSLYRLNMDGDSEEMIEGMKE